jgi:ABC-2 type transport system ATP-binding protein
MLKARNVVYEYPGKRALDGVSFELPRGSVTALVGPNGAGKTTLLRCLAALDSPLGGQLWVDGIDVQAEPRESHRLMGFLPDNFGVWPALTVHQSLAYVARANGLRAGDVGRAVTRTAVQLGLADRLGEAAGSLSRGLRQRLAIGQAIIHSPQALLLDEPASGLDPEARHSLAAVFRQLQTEGMTLLVSSHILTELAEYSSHMLVMREGRILDHRAVGSAAAAPGDVEHLRLELAAPGDLRTALANRPELGAVQFESDGLAAEFTLSGGRVERSRLVAELVAAGLPVALLQLQGTKLQESYLATVAADRKGGA